MSKSKLSKISYKLTITYALLFFVGLALVNFATLFSINYYVKQNVAQQLQAVDQVITNDVKSLADIPKMELKKFSQIADNVDVSLVYNNRTIYNTGELYDLSEQLNTDIGKVLTAESGENRITVLNDKITLNDGSTMNIQVVKDMNNEDNFIHALAGIMLFIDGFVFLLAIIVGYFISHKALSPIDMITKQAKEISASDLSARIQIDGPEDELKRLSDTFNDLIARIQWSYEKQNRFTLDASHELATPLAVIKGYIDVLDRWGKDDRTVLDESISAIKVELVNMTSLMDTLLLLAKSDNEVYKIEKSEFCMEDLIKEVVKESNLVDQNHRVECNEYTKVELNGDRKLIKQMMRAIIDNSIKYSPNKTIINIAYCLSENGVNIEISDEGIGIAKEDLDLIFDRFYRADKARSRASGGVGLGLSIVKWIVEVHDGNIEAESEIGKGTKIKIILPLNT